MVFVLIVINKFLMKKGSIKYGISCGKKAGKRFLDANLDIREFQGSPL